MSASLLNAATLPGASVGVAAQAAQTAQAAQANGPMAGFEALLAAFFGDQGQTVPGLAGQTQPLQPLNGPALVNQAPGSQALAGQAAATDPLAGKPNGKTGKAGATDTDKTDADKTGADQADATAQAAADAANAALALVTPIPANPLPVAATPAAGSADGAEAAPDAGLAGKPGASPAPNLFAPVNAAADAPAAKDAGVVAQDTSKAAAPLAAKPDTPAVPQTPNLPLTPPPLSDQTPATTAAALPAPVPLASAAAATQTKAPEPPAIAKDKVQTAKAPRVDGARAEAPNLAVAGKTPAGLPPAAADAGKDAASQEHDPAAPAPAEAKPAAADATQPENAFNLATNTAASANAAALNHAATLVRGSPQTVANLAAQIAKKLDGRSSRFDVQLDPAGLGKVDVRVEIDAAGKMTAAMNFDSQQAANELKSRAGELQRALEQAGFDMSGGMSFDVSSQGGQGGAQGQDPGANSTFRGRAFQAVLDGSADADASQLASYNRSARSGLDIRI